MQNIITSITVQKKNRNRFNIFINEQYAFSLNREHAEGLRKGDILTGNKVAELKQTDEKDHAYASALFYLQFRPRSCKEIKQYLTGKDFPLDAITAALARLENNGYVNDYEFARLWVENRLRLKPKGIYALSGELRDKGIDEQIIKDVLTDLDESKYAWEAVVPRIKRFQKLDKAEFKKKIYNFLNQRGFAYSVCKEIFDQAWKKRNGPESPG